jgi:hypothetical protein
VEVPDVPVLTEFLKGLEPPLFKYILAFGMPLLRKLPRPLAYATWEAPRIAAAERAKIAIRFLTSNS